MAAILEVKNLSVRFPAGESDVLAVRDVSFSIERGGTLGFVASQGAENP